MPAVPPLDLTFRQRLTFAAHLYKALAKQHHRDLIPLLAPLLGPGAVVCDVGAHAGQFAKLFAALTPGGRVYAFEPGAYPRAILERVVRWRRLANVTVVPCGLSDSTGEARLGTPLKASGSIGFGLAHLGADGGARPERSESVALTTLDRFAAEQDLHRLDFLKMDIEGWEVRALRGGRATIARFRPALLVELVEAHLARAGTQAADAWAELAPLGYAAELCRGPARVPVAAFAGDGEYLFVVRR